MEGGGQQRNWRAILACSGDGKARVSWRWAMQAMTY